MFRCYKKSFVWIPFSLVFMQEMLYNILLFSQIFGGVGIACLPLGLIFSFIRRPKAVITRSQYIKVGSSLHAK